MSLVRKVFGVMQTWPGAEANSGEKSFMPFLVRVVPHNGGSFFFGAPFKIIEIRFKDNTENYEGVRIPKKGR